MLDGEPQALIQGHRRGPAQELPGPGDVRAPAAGIVRNCFHGAPAVDLCTTAPRLPRTTPLNVTFVPGATRGFGDGGCSESTPTLNHVERRPSADAAVEPPMPAVSFAPRETDVTLSVFTRREGFRLTVASTMRPTTPSAQPSVFTVTGTGRQSWYGEIVS